MAATVIINELNGAGETATDKTSGTITFKKADNATVDAVNPMVLPSSGNVCSYEKVLRLEITAAPDNQIENVRVYSDGTSGQGTGVSTYYKVEGSYGQPVDLVDSTTRTSEGVTNDFFSATSGSPIDLDAINTGPFTTTGAIADYLVLGLQVDSTATFGSVPVESITFEWDES